MNMNLVKPLTYHPAPLGSIVSLACESRKTGKLHLSPSPCAHITVAVCFVKAGITIALGADMALLQKKVSNVFELVSMAEMKYLAIPASSSDPNVDPIT